MSFGDHIEELRRHLWRAIIGFGIALFASFFFGHIVVRFITAPVKDALDRYYAKHVKKVLKKQGEEDRLAQANQPTPFRAIYVPRKQFEALAKGRDPEMPRPRIITRAQQKEKEESSSAVVRWYNRWFGDAEDKDPADENDADPPYEIKEQDKDKELFKLWVSNGEPLYSQADQNEALRALLDIDNPTTLNVQEAFIVWFKVCIVCGIVLGSPWIFWQIWMFVAAGLYPHEKKLVHVYLPVSLFLFLAGVVICEVFVIPKAIEALLWFNEQMNLRPDVRLNEWLSFAIFMPVVFGVSFQTPLVMLFLNRLGIMDIDSFRNKRRMAWFAMAVFAAVVTPSTDAFSMLFLWVPMSLLFELGIILIKMSPQQPGISEEEPMPDELVEV
jgi:sec-independent protein translocase protein TatC